jgi:glycosyltransferase involved in cell wall biosynthesis
MKISVLLPTRNRLDLLKFAVESVVRQDYDDWEIIISDNHSEEDIAGYAASLNDPRVKYQRTGTLLPVTDNWNEALKSSTGDYVVMLGDDDCLVQGYFRVVSGLVRKYRSPDFVYHKALVYAYPGVLPECPDGYLRENACAAFFDGADAPFFLDTGIARTLVADSMNFRVGFDFNMQYSLISRRFIESLRSHGNFFQSPYPDYYASNVMFLKAERILVCPMPLVVIGVSPKSFGFFYSNQQEAKGVDFLQNAPQLASDPKLRAIILPGTSMNTSWLLAMELLKRNYGSDCREHGLRVNYRRYRFLQIHSVYHGYYTGGTHSRAQIIALRKSMKQWEITLLGPALAIGIYVIRLLRGRTSFPISFFSRIVTPYPRVNFRYYDGKFRNILEVFEQVNPSAGHGTDTDGQR